MILTFLVGVCAARYRSQKVFWGKVFLPVALSKLHTVALKTGFTPPKKVPATVIWGELFGGWWKFDTDGSPKNPGPFGKNVTFRTSRNYQFQVNHWLSFGECVGKKCKPLFCVSLLLTNVESNLGISGSFMIIY